MKMENLFKIYYNYVWEGIYNCNFCSWMKGGVTKGLTLNVFYCVGLRIYNIFLLFLEDINYSPEDFCLTKGILSMLFMFCYTYMFHCRQKP
jgi:hypothetical protein